jgi:nucleotide-binding universal stress UspA family protein
MRVLVPYDGTAAAEKALLALRGAGVGPADEIQIVVTDIFLPGSAAEFSEESRRRRLTLKRSGSCSFSPALGRWEEEQFLSRELRLRLSEIFPGWNIQIGMLPGFSLVSSEILERAERWNADLIVLGAPEAGQAAAGYRSGVWRVAAEAACSVHFARGAKLFERNAPATDSPRRILIVLDGSKADEAAVKAVAERNWPAGTELRMVSAAEGLTADKTAFYLTDGEKKTSPSKNPKPARFVLTEDGKFDLKALNDFLKRANSEPAPEIAENGAVRFSLIDEIHDWKADCVFIGGDINSDAKGSPLRRPLISGSAEFLLRRSACSVEIVRPNEKGEDALNAASGRVENPPPRSETTAAASVFY